MNGAAWFPHATDSILRIPSQFIRQTMHDRGAMLEDLLEGNHPRAAYPTTIISPHSLLPGRDLIFEL